MLYRLLFTGLLARRDAEAVHRRAVGLMAALGRMPGSRRVLAWWAGSPDPVLATRALGLTFPSPLGVAAGLDKDAEWYRELGALGFGYVEIGTVTAEPQPGNPRPRITRLPADRGLLNAMGFPNAGSATVERRLRDRALDGRSRGGPGDRPAPIVAVNVGRSKGASDAAADYRITVRRLAPLADLLVLNVSSPNTPGLRDLQAVDELERLVAAVRDELGGLGVRVPLLVKIAPDLADAAIDGLARAALELALDGLVCTNTTVARDGLLSESELTDRPGGVSGAPLKARSLAVLRRIRAITGDRLTLVSVGGIETPEDVLARIRAGATLVQAYTGFVYGGPSWPSEINRGLARAVRSVGASSVQQLVGSEASAGPGNGG